MCHKICARILHIPLQIYQDKTGYVLTRIIRAFSSILHGTKPSRQSVLSIYPNLIRLKELIQNHLMYKIRISSSEPEISQSNPTYHPEM